MSENNEETKIDVEEGNASFGSGSTFPSFGAGLQQPTFSFSGTTDFSIQKFSDDGTTIPTATYADDDLSFPSTVAFATSTTTPKIQFGVFNTPGGDGSGSSSSSNSTKNSSTTNSNNKIDDDSRSNSEHKDFSFGGGPNSTTTCCTRARVCDLIALWLAKRCARGYR